MEKQKRSWLKEFTILVNEAAEIYDKHPDFIYGLIRSGLPHYKLDGNIRVSIAQIEQLLYAEKFIKLGHDPNTLSAFIPDYHNPDNWKKYVQYKKRPRWLRKTQCVEGSSVG